VPRPPRDCDEPRPRGENEGQGGDKKKEDEREREKKALRDERSAGHSSYDEKEDLLLHQHQKAQKEGQRRKG